MSREISFSTRKPDSGAVPPVSTSPNPVEPDRACYVARAEPMRRRAIWTIAKTFQTNMTIFTKNTNIEMARSDGCQSLTFSAIMTNRHPA
jgi:hypothetical protein